MTLRRAVVAALVLVVVAGVALGLLTGLLPSRLSHRTPAVVGASHPTSTLGPRPAPGASEGPVPAPAPSADLPAPVLKAATAPKQSPDPALIRARIAAVNRKGLTGVLGALLVDSTGKALYASNANRPLMPASTEKLLTSASALELLGPYHRFRTRVVTTGPSASGAAQIVLVGGGDPYLAASPAAGGYPARATLSGLASETARALRRQGRRAVTLAYDDSLFTGPAWNPLWPSFYRDQAGPTSALWVHPKAPNSARDATSVFANALRARGLAVSLRGRTKAPKSASELASVSSMTVQQILTQLLYVSDNDAAEVMFRQVGLKSGHGGSIVGSRQAVQEQMTKLGVWRPGMVVRDGSGLGRQNRVPPAAFVKLLRVASSDDQPQLRSLLTALSVAGVEGSLRTRFLEPFMHPADGIVRGKTGTLTGVRALAGYLRPPDGSLLYYSLVVNRSSDDDVAADYLQRVLVAWSGCGCER